jgi:endonuclease/exonuclease/phosphatase family metal-dependent hydrolase
MKRRLLNIAVVVGIALTGMAAPNASAGPNPAPPAAQAASVLHKYLQFNMCGNKCRGGNLDVANDVINSVNNSSPQPFAITLNEVCRNQYDHIYGTLVPYYGRYEVTVPGACDNGADYGIAVLVRTSNYTFHNAWRLPGGHEARKMVCIRTTATGGGTQPLIACSTHIDNHSDVQAGQIAFVAARGREMWSGHHVLIGGDFNVKPNDSKLNPMYSPEHAGGSGVFNEADTNGFSRAGGGVGSDYNEYTGGCFSTPCGYRANDWKPSGKIDFIFLSRYDFTGTYGDATYALRSDHTPLWAWTIYV